MARLDSHLQRLLKLAATVRRKTLVMARRSDSIPKFWRTGARSERTRTAS